MPRRGENITKRKDGRWEARILKGHTAEGKPLYKSLYAHTYSEAKARKLEYLMLAPEKEPPESQKSDVFSHVLNMFLQHKKYQVKESTFACYSNIIEHHIRPNLGNIPLPELDSIVIENFIADKLTNGRKDHTGGLSAKTVRDILMVLSLVLKYAERIGIMNINHIHYTLPQLEKKEVLIFSIDEVKTITDYSMNSTDCQKFGICLSLYTGLRIGELCALQWKHIDLDQKVISVRKTLMRIQDTDPDSAHKTKIVIHTPKTSAGRREIPIPSFLISKLHDLYESHHEEDFFLTGTSRYIEPSNYYVKYRKWLYQMQIPKRSFHTLRHTFATRCIENGFDIKTLSEILGHADVQITLNRYVHSSLEHKRLNMEKMTILYQQSIKVSHSTEICRKH